MRVTNKPKFEFTRDELNYAWVAGLLRDWLTALAETPGVISPHWGNPEAFKDECYRLADAFKVYADDQPDMAGFPPTCRERIKDFAENFETFWREQ